MLKQLFPLIHDLSGNPITLPTSQTLTLLRGTSYSYVTGTLLHLMYNVAISPVPVMTKKKPTIVFISSDESALRILTRIGRRLGVECTPYNTRIDVIMGLLSATGYNVKILNYVEGLQGSIESSAITSLIEDFTNNNSECKLTHLFIDSKYYTDTSNASTTVDELRNIRLLAAKHRLNIYLGYHYYRSMNTQFTFLHDQQADVTLEVSKVRNLLTCKCIKVRPAMKVKPEIHFTVTSNDNLRNIEFGNIEVNSDLSQTVADSR